jgi:hypothetical protein
MTEQTHSAYARPRRMPRPPSTRRLCRQFRTPASVTVRLDA